VVTTTEAANYEQDQQDYQQISTEQISAAAKQ
jgi:hypothetical protein